ncbi:hypothetical protein NTCA1_49580 [Novosphingobium sp. TCA1]|nr:hypothetical protein NTCA1_49580 [Novosphingobium sp. TCA1]
MRTVCRLAFENRAQQLCYLLFVVGSRPPWPGFPVKSYEPLFKLSLAPVADRWVRGSEPARNCGVGLAIG